jgi:uncharacterized protein DUF4331
MSNHFSAANFRFPGDDRRLELTDLYAFTSAEDPGKTVLIIDVNPTVKAIETDPSVITTREFHPSAVYRINIDNDGDARADAAFTFTFSERDNGAQTGTAYFATGARAREAEPAGQLLTESLPVSFDATARPVEAGEIRLFAGARSEPFFADVEGAMHGFKWTGHDDFAGTDVLSIVLEVPHDMLGADPMIGIWATVSLRRDGTLTQMDRGGNPTINPFVNPDSEKDRYNTRQPADDVANYLEPWSRLLENGGYQPDEAKRAALMMLPDILRYDRGKPAAYTNGRTPIDDVFSFRFAWLSNGKVPPTGLAPHDDLLHEFPYLGAPHS